MIILAHKFVIFADNVRHIRSSAQRTIDHIRHKSVGVHFMRYFKRTVSHNVERKEFLYHRYNLVRVIIIVIGRMHNTISVFRAKLFAPVHG